MKSRPSIGLILLRAEWFDTVVALPALVQAVQSDQDAIVALFQDNFELDHTWVINSTPSLDRSAKEIRSSQVDLFVLVFQVWAEDAYLLPLLRSIAGRPLAVWCYQPWQRLPEKISFIEVLRGSGPVGTFEGLGTLRNLAAPYFFTYGSPADGRVIEDLLVAARGAQVWRALRSARFGLLPSRNEQMQSTFVDEFRLMADIGPQVQMLSVAELKSAADCLPEREVMDYLEHLRQEYPRHGVSDETLALAARASLGLAHLAVDHHLDVLSINDISTELHATFGLRPCLYPPMLYQANIPLGLEGDLGAAAALFVLHRLVGSPLLFVEFWFWDMEENLLVGGHAGPQDPRLAHPGGAWISLDYEYAQSDSTTGAHLQFVARPGRVTLFQLRGTTQGWQALLAGGEALASAPRLEGYPHAVIRLDAPLEEFLPRVAQVGSTQHWIMAYGDVLAEVEAFCRLAGVPVEVID